MIVGLKLDYLKEWYVNGKLIVDPNKNIGRYQNGNINIGYDTICNSWTHHFIKIKPNIRVDWLVWFNADWNGWHDSNPEFSSRFIDDVRFFDAKSNSFTESDIKDIYNDKIFNRITRITY